MLVFLSLVKDVNDSVHIVLIIMCVASMGFYYPGLKSNPLDLAQNYAAITMAFATAAGGLSGVIAPIVATSLTPHVCMMVLPLQFCCVIDFVCDKRL